MIAYQLGNQPPAIKNPQGFDRLSILSLLDLARSSFNVMSAHDP